MREIYFNSDITPKSVNEIKLLALYYDKINIVNDEVYSPKFETINGNFKFTGTENIQFIPETFRTDYKVLIDENLISITEKNINLENENLFANEISKILDANHDFIFPRHPIEKNGRIITEEVYSVMKNMWGFE